MKPMLNVNLKRVFLVKHLYSELEILGKGNKKRCKDNKRTCLQTIFCRVSMLILRPE